MLERFDYSVALPYERRRDKDFDGSTMIVSTKPFGEGRTEQIICLSPKGRVTERLIVFSSPNSFERQYEFAGGRLTVQARSETTNFGAICYNKAGVPARIRTAPFYITDYIFQRDALTEQERDTISEELQRYDEQIAILKERYGGFNNIPAEAWPNMAQSCPTHYETGERLRKLRGPADFFGFDTSELVFKQEKWVVVEQVPSSRSLAEALVEIERIDKGEVKRENSWISKEDKTKDVLIVDWEEPFVYDDKKLTISKAGGQLIFRQESLAGPKKKIIQAPLQINYGDLQKIMSDPVAWDKVAIEYSTNFFAEL